MMGQLDSGQDKLFYSFNLDNHVPHTHLLRGIDRALDLGDLREHLPPFYSPILNARRLTPVVACAFTYPAGAATAMRAVKWSSKPAV
jgi:hypothetical protein